MPLQARSILDGIFRHAAAQPNRIAIRMEEASITYRQLVEQIERIVGSIHARRLSARRIGLYLANHPDFLPLFYGIAAARAIAVPLPSDLPAEQIEEYKTHLDVSEVWSSDTIQELLAETISVVPFEGTCSQPSPDDLFYMAVSSGSTGKPKGILRNHRSWAESFDRMAEEFGIGREDTILLPGPLHYSASLIAALQVLDQGGEVVLLPRFREEILLDHLLEKNITAVFMVPTMVAKLLSFLKEKQEVYPLLKERKLTVVTAGAKLETSLKLAWLDLFPNSRLFEYYGAAELSFVSLLRPDEQLTAGDSVGKVFAGVELVIMDDKGQRLGPQQVGQVYVKSGMIAQGYGHKDADKFLPSCQGFFSVGDMGYLDSNGYLYLTGRKQEMILRGGINIFPQEIEQVLRQHPEVKEAAVFGIPDQLMGERIVAAVVSAVQGVKEETHEGSKVNTQLFTRNDSPYHAWLKARLPQSRWPDFYWIVGQLPLGTTGKIDRPSLRHHFLLVRPTQ